MDQIIFRFPGQRFVGLAKRQQDKNLNLFAVALVNVMLKKGDAVGNDKVIEMLTDTALLKEQSNICHLDIEAVAVVG